MSANPNVRAANKYSINLLQPELFPEPVLLTLPRVVLLWVAAFTLMLGWGIVTDFQHQSLQEKLNVLQKEKVKQDKLFASLTTQLTSRKVDGKLADKLATIKLLMSNKKALHEKLTNPNKTYVAGFATAMNELAQLHHQDIRLQTININNDNMTFSGLALTPEAVPAWLAGFENSLLLSGKSFSHFKLSENEQHITEFMVSSKVQEVSLR
ncbi:PilN domain-containing protein [Candidatus Colwellia aromaticivorans]|uniref:PilN domain-containing protein n=1 Tax=Candidatus Colwellia aromaticivorans TaxID=2267621 RepID=UPI000DF42398|nr:PilN domain-containing protein [Candidatus Colwellia aromaticivorans]